MLKLELHTSMDPGQWRSLVAALRGTPLHLPEVWLASAGDDQIVHLLWKNDRAQFVGAAVALISQSKVLKVFKGGRSLLLPVTPAFIPGEGCDRDLIYAALVEFARREGYRKVTVAARWGEDFSAGGCPSGAIDERLVEFTIDLRHDLESLAKALHKKHRKNIRSAEEQGLEIVEDNSLEAFMLLRGMQQSSSERAAERGNSYGIQDERAYRKMYDLVYQNGPGRVLFAKKAGEYVAALAFLAFDRKAITVRSGSTDKGYETSAMYLLQYELIRRLKEEGCQELNIGGVPAEAAEAGHPQHGLFDYKRYYGGLPCLRTGLTITL